MHPILILTIALAVGIVAWLVVHYYTGAFAESGSGGFREWVKNPELKYAASAYFEARDALTVPDDISPEEIQAMVDRVFIKEDTDFIRPRES